MHSIGLPPQTEPQVHPLAVSRQSVMAVPDRSCLGLHSGSATFQFCSEQAAPPQLLTEVSGGGFNNTGSSRIFSERATGPLRTGIHNSVEEVRGYVDSSIGPDVMCVTSASNHTGHDMTTSSCGTRRFGELFLEAYPTSHRPHFTGDGHTKPILKEVKYQVLLVIWTCRVTL